LLATANDAPWPRVMPPAELVEVITTLIPPPGMDAESPLPGTWFGSQFWALFQFPSAVFVQVMLAERATLPLANNTSATIRSHLVMERFVFMDFFLEQLQQKKSGANSDRRGCHRMVRAVLKCSH